MAAYLDALVGPRRAAGKRGHRDGGDDPDAGSALPHPLDHLLPLVAQTDPQATRTQAQVVSGHGGQAGHQQPTREWWASAVFLTVCL